MAKTKKNKDVTETTGQAVVVAPVQEEQQVQSQFSIETLIAQAIEKGTPVDTMERILAMRKELRAEKAKEAFDEDMAKFQGECPTIKKTKSVPTKTGKIAYSYAPIESIVEQTKFYIQKYGFSYAVKTETLPGSVKSTCIVKHELGHSEESSFEVPLGNKTEIMSQTQVVAAALTFAKRYAFCNAFGIMTGDADNDGDTNSLQSAKPAVVAKKPVVKAEPKVETPEQFEARMKVIGEIAKYLKDMNQNMTEKAEQFFRDITMKELQKLEETYKTRRDAYVAAHPEAIPTI
jgi:hypothetical protein